MSRLSPGRLRWFIACGISLLTTPSPTDAAPAEAKPLKAGIFESLIAEGTPANRRHSEGDVLVRHDGTLLAAWSDFYGGSRDDAAARISAARSTDGGRTWGQRFTLRENSGRLNVMSVSFLRLTPRDVLLFHLVKNSRTDLDAVVCRSTDDGATWSDPTLITKEPGYFVMNNARVVRLASGRIVCPMSFTDEVWTSSESFRTVGYFSDDNGRTWQRGRGIVTCPKRGAMEPGLLELRDGRLLQIIRTQLGQLWHAHSSDGGDTWTDAAPWTVATPEAPSTLVRLPKSGDLLLIYNPNVVAGTGHGGPRTPLVAATSSDEGKTWSTPRVIESNATETYAYTSVTFHEGRALLTYYVAPIRNDLLSLKFRSIPIEWFHPSPGGAVK